MWNKSRCEGTKNVQNIQNGTKCSSDITYENIK